MGMNFQHLEVYREAGENALVIYGLEKEYRLVLHHCSENVTYMVVHSVTSCRYAALRVSRPGYHTLEEMKAEVQWLDQIVKEGTVVTAKPIRSPDGQTVVCVSVGGKMHHCVLCEYLEGQAPVPEEGDGSFWWFNKTGEAAAKLHMQIIKWSESSRLCRPVWDYEALLGESGLFGNWRNCEELGNDGFTLLNEVCMMIKMKLEEYGRESRNFGLIHSDLRAGNLLAEGRRIKVLDFDDSGFGWFLFDLAASFSFIENHPMTEVWMEAWLKGYTTIRRLEQQDYEMIPTFLMSRRIQLLAWITSHKDSAPVSVYDEGFADGTIRMARVYCKKGNKSCKGTA